MTDLWGEAGHEGRRAGCVGFRDNDGKGHICGCFNLSDTERFAVCADEMELAAWIIQGMKLEELWSGETILNNADNLEATVPAHGARLFRIERPA